MLVDCLPKEGETKAYHWQSPDEQWGFWDLLPLPLSVGGLKHCILLHLISSNFLTIKMQLAGCELAVTIHHRQVGVWICTWEPGSAMTLLRGSQEQRDVQRSTSVQLVVQTQSWVQPPSKPQPGFEWEENFVRTQISGATLSMYILCDWNLRNCISSRVNAVGPVALANCRHTLC